MTTIETKIAKNGNITLKRDGRRDSYREVISFMDMFGNTELTIKTNRDNINLANDQYTGKFDTDARAYIVSDQNGDKFTFESAEEVINRLAHKNFENRNIITADNQPANVTVPETDGSEDDPDEDAFDLPYDVDSEPVAHVTFHDTDIKFLPGGQEIQRIRINREQILIVNGETCLITSKQYNARYDAFEKTFYLSTPSYPNYGMRTTEENFWAAMAERGACSFDTPKDKTALANYQTFCRAKNLTGAERELKLYNICRKALSELWRR